MDYQVIRIITVYAVYETTNEWGAHGALITVTEDKSKADAAAERRGWYNSKADIVEKPAALLDDGKVLLLHSAVSYPLDTDLPAELKARREAALAKLSPEEIKLLGIR